jgi:hypothetical protein
MTGFEPGEDPAMSVVEKYYYRKVAARLTSPHKITAHDARSRNARRTPESFLKLPSIEFVFR